MKPDGHTPVLLKETIAFLDLQAGDSVIDCTLGGGGHASAILEATAPNGRLLGIEWDRRTLEETRKTLERFGSRAMLVHGSYRDLDRLARSYAFPLVSGILFDLGYSSFQIDDPERGFSFRHDAPLDMRFNDENELTAFDVVNSWSKDELVRILRDYGEERAAGRIAVAIVKERERAPISSTKQLAMVVMKAKSGPRPKTHPATQAFQAIRIAVNDELGNVREALPKAVDLLEEGGRIAIITFHSLEDRIVKHFFQERSDLRIITERPVPPGEHEIESNPRSRSAKLRVAVKTTHVPKTA
jgi:16S rRNA (cytosine1402-N4)-methyltransferase